MADGDLDPCVKAILCGLSAPVILGVNQVISQAVTLLDAELVQIEAQLGILNVAVVPLEALSVIATNTLEAIKTVVKFLPVSLVAGCVDLGTGIGALNSALDAAEADAQNTLESLNRQLGAVAVLEAARADINQAVAFLNSIQLAISECT